MPARKVMNWCCGTKSQARIENDLVLRDRQIIALQSQLDNKQRFIQELERTILENHAQFREQLARTLSTVSES